MSYYNQLFIDKTTLQSIIETKLYGFSQMEEYYKKLWGIGLGYETEDINCAITATIENEYGELTNPANTATFKPPVSIISWANSGGNLITWANSGGAIINFGATQKRNIQRKNIEGNGYNLGIILTSDNQFRLERIFMTVSPEETDYNQRD